MATTYVSTVQELRDALEGLDPDARLYPTDDYSQIQVGPLPGDFIRVEEESSQAFLVTWRDAVLGYTGEVYRSSDAAVDRIRSLHKVYHTVGVRRIQCVGGIWQLTGMEVEDKELFLTKMQQ